MKNKQNLHIHSTYADGKDKPEETIYRNGDIVIHKIYGEGIVVGIDSGVLQIAFAHPHGVKKILASHPSIRKKNKNDYS